MLLGGFMKNDALKNFALKAKRRLSGREERCPAKIKVITNEDNEFKSKVEYLLSQEDVVTNPVHFLMDSKVLKDMDDCEKERYLLSTLDKYKRFRSQIENNSCENKFCM